jgi:hypothetical protein
MEKTYKAFQGRQGRAASQGSLEKMVVRANQALRVPQANQDPLELVAPQVRWVTMVCQAKLDQREFVEWKVVLVQKVCLANQAFLAVMAPMEMQDRQGLQDRLEILAESCSIMRRF